MVSREESDGTVAEADGVEGVEKWRTEEGWWRVCGRCRHPWEEGEGHVFPEDLSPAERTRRGKVVGRIEEILQVRRFHASQMGC